MCRYPLNKMEGLRKKKKKHLLEVGRALMFSRNIPQFLWGEAILTTTYLINCMPSKSLNLKVPIDLLKQAFPSVNFFGSLPHRVFGCATFVHVHRKDRSKLESRALKCVFVGYSSNQKGYKCFHPLTRRTFVTMDVKFFESLSYYSQVSFQEEGRVENLSYLTQNEPTTIVLLCLLEFIQAETDFREQIENENQGQ